MVAAVFAKMKSIWCRIFMKGEALSSNHEDPRTRIILDVFSHFLIQQFLLKGRDGNLKCCSYSHVLFATDTSFEVMAEL